MISRKGGERRRRLVFFPPLRRGDTGGFFECLCAVPGSSSTRLKIALASGEGSAQGLNPLVLASWSVRRGAWGVISLPSASLATLRWFGQWSPGPPSSATAGVVARNELKVHFFLPHARPVPVKSCLVQAGSGSGLLTRPSSATAALNRRRVTWRTSVGRTAAAGDPRRTKQDTTHSEQPWRLGR